ncbi:MAG: TolC family protein [Salegentibacter sp.]
MKIKFLMLTVLFAIVAQSTKAQEKHLSLEEAVNMALASSDEAKISEAKVNSATQELQVTKNNRYPDFKLSGQYSYLTNANVDLQLSTGNSDPTPEDGASQPAAQPQINQLLLGQANVSMPIFSGFKLKNSIKAGENSLKAAKLNAQNSNEEIALQTIQDYLNLYKARKTVDLVQESLKSAQQRVKDFNAMEQNGLLARNDLLKAQLQESNVQLSLDEAKKTAEILSYKLAVTLKLPEDTEIETSDSEFQRSGLMETGAEISRSDLEALKFQEQAAEKGIEVAKGNYFPSIALVGGYVALDLQNALTVSNAMNVGVGVSYNLSEIFKNKSEVKLAESKANELRHSIDLVSDKIKIQVKNARQDYKLAQKKFDVYSKSQQQAVENYRIVKDKYDNGLMNTNDLLEADVQQLQAKINLAYAQANIAQKYYELLQAQGKLTNEFKK